MTDGRRFDEIDDVVELEPLGLDDRPDGPGVAAMLAAGIGIFVLGLATVLSEASVPIHDFFEDLDFGRGVGPLAGKTIFATVAYFASWLALGAILRNKDVTLKLWFYIALALGVLGAIMTFPPVFLSFATE